MSHASELIRQIIRKQRLHTIYPGQDEASFNDLLQVGWCQIERVLYKFRATPHCRACFNQDRPNDSILYRPAENEYGIIKYQDLFALGITQCPKCKAKLAAEPLVAAVQDTYGGSESILYRGQSKVFNLWSQVSRTVILAHIKKEGRDRKNSPTYIEHVDGKPKPINDAMDRFLAEAREICKYNDDHLHVLAALETLLTSDDKPHEGIIGKLVKASKLSRATVTSFLKMIRLRSYEFTDSPLNQKHEGPRHNKHNLYVDKEE